MELLPEKLRTEANRAVLEYLDNKSAHIDLVEELTAAAELLEDISFYCPDISEFRYVIAYTGSVIFAFACGMRSAIFRLSPESASLARRYGAKEVEGLKGWVSFQLFEQEVDVLFWCEKAHSYAGGNFGV